METIIAVVFGIAFGAIVTAGFTMSRKPKTPTKTGSGGGGKINVDNQEVKDQNNQIQQAE